MDKLNNMNDEKKKLNGHIFDIERVLYNHAIFNFPTIHKLEAKINIALTSKSRVVNSTK